MGTALNTPDLGWSQAAILGSRALLFQTAVACGSRDLKRLAVFLRSVVACSFQVKRLVSCLHEIDFTRALKRKR